MESSGLKKSSLQKDIFCQITSEQSKLIVEQYALDWWYQGGSLYHPTKQIITLYISHTKCQAC